MYKNLSIIFLTLLIGANSLYAKKNLGYYLGAEAFQGLTMYSWLVPLGLNLHDRTAAGVGLLTPALWTGLSYANSLTTRQISGGMILASLYGGWNGLLQGLLLGNKDNAWGIALLSSTLENLGNYQLFYALNLNAASAQRWMNFSELGLFHVAIVDNFKSNAAVYAIVPFIESYASVPVFMKDTKATWGDAFFEQLSSSTVLGSVWLISLGIDENALEHEGFRVATGLGLTSVGYGLGYYLSRKRDISTGGALFTLFVPLLANTVVGGTMLLFNGSPSALLLTSGVLMPVGVYGSYFLMSKQSIGVKGRDTGRFKFFINPYAGAFALVKGARRGSSVPLGMIAYSF